MTLQQATKAPLRACRPNSMGFSSRLAGTFQFPDVSDDRPPAAKQRALGLCAAPAYDVCEYSLNSADVVSGCSRSTAGGIIADLLTWTGLEPALQPG
ncbi:hypothetical protein ACQPTN_15015 [Bradyrhizobium sp. 13971]